MNSVETDSPMLLLDLQVRLDSLCQPIRERYLNISEQRGIEEIRAAVAAERYPSAEI